MVSGLELKGNVQRLETLSKMKPLSSHVSFLSFDAAVMVVDSLIAAASFPPSAASVFSRVLSVFSNSSKNMIVWRDTGAERIRLFSTQLARLEVCVVARQVDVIRGLRISRIRLRLQP